MKMNIYMCIFYTHTHTLIYESLCCTPEANEVKVAQSCPILCDPMDYIYSTWNSPGQKYWSGQPSPLPGHLSNPETEPRSLALQAHSLPAEPQGKHKNTGMGSLSFLQRIFPTQESNRGPLHCKWILYQLSYQGSLL